MKTLHYLLRGKLSRDVKKRMRKTLIWIVVLYGSEKRNMIKEDIRWLKAMQIWTWRRMEKISWMEHKANEKGVIIGE